jgi:hypothetical protein
MAVEQLGHGAARRWFAVYRSATLLGTSGLEHTVVPHERAAGRFYVTPAFRSVVAVFTKYRAAARSDDPELMRSYVRALDALGLSLWEGGVRLHARVELVSTWGINLHVLHVSGSDERLWAWRRPDSKHMLPPSPA